MGLSQDKKRRLDRWIEEKSKASYLTQEEKQILSAVKNKKVVTESDVKAEFKRLKKKRI
jgi:hypothetical protein